MISIIWFNFNWPVTLQQELTEQAQMQLGLFFTNLYSLRCKGWAAWRKCKLKVWLEEVNSPLSRYKNSWTNSDQSLQNNIRKVIREEKVKVLHQSLLKEQILISLRCWKLSRITILWHKMSKTACRNPSGVSLRTWTREFLITKRPQDRCSENSRLVIHISSTDCFRIKVCWRKQVT